MKFKITSSIKDEKEVRAFLRSPKRMKAFLSELKGEKIYVDTDYWILGIDAGLFTEDHELTSKAWELGKELGYDKEEVARLEAERDALRNSVKREVSALPEREIGISLVVPIKKITETTLSKDGQVGYDYSLEYDRDLLEKRIAEAVYDALRALGLKIGPENYVGGTGSGFPMYTHDSKYEELSRVKYQ